MNLEAIRIAIDTGELEKAKKLLGDVENQAKKTDKGVSGLTDSFFSFKGVIASVVSTALIGNLIKMSDTFTNIESKLKLATKSTNEYAKAQAELFKIAQESRVSFSDTVDLYSKLSISTESLKISQERLLKVTELIGKAGIIGGGSKESINAALVQLGQGFASGTLRGEELNSVMEQTPRLARAIAEGMGVTVGELRKLGEQGMITAEKVVKALESQSNSINNEFSQIQTTIGQSLTVMNNSMVNAVGQMDNMSNASKNLSGIMIQLAKGIDFTTNALKNYELANLRIQDINKVKSSNDAKKAIELIEQENIALTTSTELKDVAYRAYLGETQIQAKLIENKVKIRDLTKQQTDIEKNANEPTPTSTKKAGIDTQLEITIGKMSDYEKKQYDIYMQSTKWLESGGDMNEVLSVQAKKLKELEEQHNKGLIKQQTKDTNDLAKEYQDLAKIGMTDYEKKLYSINLEYVDFIKKGGDVATGLALLADGEKKLNEETAKSKLEERNKALDKQLAYDKSIFELKEKQVGLLDDENEKNRTLSQLYHDRQVQEIKAMAEKEPRNDDFYQKSLQYEDELLQKNLQRYSVTGQIIEEVGSGMKSTMMDFFYYTSKGFGDMRKMVIDVGNMIYQAIVKQMVVNPLVSAATSAVGAYFATPAVAGSATASNASTLGIQGVDSNMNSLPESIRLHAKGGVYGSNSLGSYRNGVYDSPQLFAFAKGGTPNMGVFGEAGSEAIMPLTRDSSGSLGVKAVGSGSQDVKVEIINKGTNEMQVTNATSRNDISGQVISIVIDGIVNNKQNLRTIMGGR